MGKSRRVMNRDGYYEVEERAGNSAWELVGRYSTIDEAKELLRELKALENDDDTD